MSHDIIENQKEFAMRVAYDLLMERPKHETQRLISMLINKLVCFIILFILFSFFLIFIK